MQDLYDVRATLSSPPVMKFLEIDKNVESVKKGIALPPIEFDGAQFPVNTVIMDHNEGLLFVGTGVKHSVAHYMNASQLRGNVFVYKVVADGIKPNLVQLTVLSLSTGVKTLAWDPSRRCLIVGLATGTIGYYVLSNTASPGAENQASYSLQLMGEMDFHDDTVVATKLFKREIKTMLVYETKDYCFVASNGSKATLVDLSTGAIVSQLAKGGNKFASADIDPCELIGFVGTQSGSVQMIDFSTSTPTLMSEVSPNHATTNDVSLSFCHCACLVLTVSLTAKG